MSKRISNMTPEEVYQKECRRMIRLIRQGKFRPDYELVLADIDGLTQFIRLDTSPFIANGKAALIESYLRQNMGLDEDIVGLDTSTGHLHSWDD